jgi:2-hydroxychromene-2-carboxylate isomerase
MKSVELFYDFSSPNAYFAAAQLPELAARHGARVEWRPFFLGGLFKLLDAPMTPGMTSAEKAAYGLLELERWAKKYRIPFRFASRFPFNTIRPLRAALLAPELGFDPGAFALAVFRAAWAEDEDVSDRAVLARILGELAADPDAVLARIEEPEVKERLKLATEQARARGVFGAPSIFVGDELFFGKDRMEFVEDALGR